MSLMYAKLQLLQGKVREQELEKLCGNAVTSPIAADKREQIEKLLDKIRTI